MSMKIKARPAVRTGGANAFIQEAQKAMKIPFIGFKEGCCHRRIIITSKVTKETEAETGEEIDVIEPGLAVLHMFQDFMGVPVMNPGFSDTGIELEPEYTRTMFNNLIGDILAFDVDNYQPLGTTDHKLAYANFLRYVENFANRFDVSKNADRTDILLLRSALYQPTEGATDLDADIIKQFKGKWSTEISGTKYADLFIMTFLEAVKTWILDNVEMKILFTPTANANWSGVPYYGALADPNTEEGEHQEKVVAALASIARVLSQRDFEMSDGAEGLTRGTKSYNDAYNLWVNVPKTNRQMIQRPTLNGVIFIFDALSDDKCRRLVADDRGETKLRMAIHGISGNKISKIKNAYAYDEVLENPDFIDVVFKYTTGETKSQMGMGMSVSRWEGKEDTFLPFKEIEKYIEQTNSPNISDRINSYQPFPFEEFVDGFKKFLVRKNTAGELDFIKEDETLMNICSRGLEILDLDLNAETVSVDDILKGGAANAMAGMVGSLGINFAAKAQPQQVQPQQAQPQPVAPTPEVQQPQQPVAPTPEVQQVQQPAPQPVQQPAPQPVMQQPVAPSPEVQPTVPQPQQVQPVQQVAPTPGV